MLSVLVFVCCVSDFVFCVFVFVCCVCVCLSLVCVCFFCYCCAVRLLLLHFLLRRQRQDVYKSQPMPIAPDRPLVARLPI